MALRGKLVVIAGPSGVGKGTLVARLLKAVPGLWLSVSATTRAMRAGDAEGVTYFFKTNEEFDELVENNGLLEWAQFSGNRYGTPRATVEDHLDAGETVILEIEVQGAAQIVERMPEAKRIFIAPPSMEELERRLRSRATDSEEAIVKRLATAHDEIAQKEQFDYIIVNDDLESASNELNDTVRAIMTAER